jgi:hypothetical protein
MIRSQTSAEGSLYELVARGVKDKYFIQDDAAAIHPFDWRYDKYPASIPEERWTVPINPGRFGGTCEFEFELPADVLIEAYLEISLPSLMPPAIDVSAGNIVDEGGYSYGYVNGVGYFLFEKIEIYQDKILLQEVSGDTLYAATLTKGSYNQSFMSDEAAGVHDGSQLGIMRAGAPKTLELRVPMIGCAAEGDKGLPLCGLRDQPFRLRLTLRHLEKLIESDGPYVDPWNHTFTQTTLAGSTSFKGLARDLIKSPTLVLRTKQLYLSNETRDILEKETIEIPYIRYFDNIFNINQKEYNSVQNGAGGSIVRYLDASYTVERVLTYFRNMGDVRLNRLWKFNNSFAPDGQYYTSIKLTVAGKTREEAWGPYIWQNVVGNAKEDRGSSKNIAIMNWTRGWRISDGSTAIREPTGGLNFTTADRPMLTVVLNDVAVDPALGYKQVFMSSCCESWALYKIRNRRGGLEYAN